MSEEGRSGRKSITVGTSVVVVSDQQTFSKRVLFSLINTSTGGQTISIAFGQDAAASQGVVLAPGGYYSESKDPSFDPTNDQITAVSSGAGGTLALMERVITPGSK